MTHGHSRFGAVLALGLALGACGDVTDPDGIQGTYELVEAEGQSLPAVVFDGETDFGHMVATAESGSLTLRGSTYTERVVFNLVLDGTNLGSEPVVVNGDYTVEGAILEFDPDRADSPAFTGTLSGGVLTTSEVDPDFGEMTLVWER